MAKITLNGVDALTESGGVVTIPGAANLVLGTDSVPSAAIQADAVTGAKIENNPTIAGNLTVSGLSTLTGNTTVMGDLTVQGSSIVTVSETLQIEDKNIELGFFFEEIQLEDATGYVLLEDGNGNIITESVVAITDATANAGGITLKGTTDKTMLWLNADDAWTFNQHLFPSADNASDLGSTAKRWRNIYTTDLHLANERGNWTVIEEEDYLTLRNNKTNKVYKLVMEEIE